MGAAGGTTTAAAGGTTTGAERRRLKRRRLAKTKFVVTAILAGKASELSSGVTDFVSKKLVDTLKTICPDAESCAVTAITVSASTTTAAEDTTTAAPGTTTAAEDTTTATDLIFDNSFRCQLSVTIVMIF